VSHPENTLMGWFFLALVAALGTLVGWSLMSFTTMMATASAVVIASVCYPAIGMPVAWPLIAIGLLVIFLHCALGGAREIIAAQRAFGQLQSALDKTSNQVMDVSMGIVGAKRMMNFQDLDRLVKTASDMKLMVTALADAFDDVPYLKMMELSVKETLNHVLQRFTIKQQEAMEIIGEDLQVIGNRDAFESIVFHLLENHLQYVTQGKISKLICTLNADKRTMTLINHLPKLTEADKKPFMDLTFSLKDSHEAQLSLLYVQQMLHTMDAKLEVQVSDLILFQVQFPAFIPQPKEAQMYYLDDE